MSNPEEQIAACRRAERKAAVRIAFGLANVPLVVGVYSFAPALWAKASILYLALVSIFPLIEGPYASRSGKRAERRSLESQSSDTATGG